MSASAGNAAPPNQEQATIVKKPSLLDNLRPSTITNAQDQVAARNGYRDTPALFGQEGPQLYGAAEKHNAEFAKPPVRLAGAVGSYQTPLSPRQELAFRQWVTGQQIPFDPNAARVDYDMRGFWLQNAGKGRAANGHFPDTFKTPYDTTFSGESKYATADNPFVWRGNTLIDARTGQPIFAS